MAGGLRTLAEHLGRLVATKTTTPLPALFLILVGAVASISTYERERPLTVGSQVRLSSGDEGAELALILALDVLEGDDGRSFLVDDRAKAGLALHDYVRHAHLPAESREEYDELNGVDVMSNDNERCLLRLDERDGVVEPVLDEEWLLRVLSDAIWVRKDTWI